MKNRLLLTLLFSVFIALSTTAQDLLWSDVDRTTTNAREQVEKARDLLPEHYRLVKLNTSKARQLQQQVPLENFSSPTLTAVVPFSIPLPEGGIQSNVIVESPILSRELQAQHPSVKTYQLRTAVGKRFSGRLTMTPAGITGLVFTDSGAAYITPFGSEQDGVHMVYYVKDVKVKTPVQCAVKDELASMQLDGQQMGMLAGDCQLRTFRLGIAATGEYTAWAGDQANALTYITTTVNNVTAIYERDATIRFTLVTNNSVIFTDALTDPYPTLASPDGPLLITNHNTLNTNLGNGNYDLGMVFNRGWNGGLASLSVVCNNSFKGRSASGLTFGTGPNPTAGPQGPIFDGTVAHEIAHQFSATHTHSATNGGCGGGNVSPATAYEPGGGSTIMAYAGVCAPNAYQNNSDLYFHGGNIAQIQNYATSGSASCAVITAVPNTAPTVSVAAPAYTIPIGTPFTLSATTSDADGDVLQYTWEQIDAGFTSATSPQPTNTQGPNFRSFPPNSSSSRTFPRIQDIISGVSSPYEVLTTVGRTMNFRLTARDGAVGGGCTSEADVAVTTDAATGPFAVTSQSTATNWVANGSNTAAITWNVANSNNAPVNCANVNILFSQDGGLTYPFTLLANAPNNGSANITIPSLPTSAGRVRVQAVGNIFFDINDAMITITSSCAAEGTNFVSGNNVTAPAGSATLDLALSPQYGSIVTLTGTLEASDPASTLAVNNLAPGACINFGGNEYRYDTYTFTVNVAGTYTFTRSGTTSGSAVFNLYSGSFNPASPCSNLIISSRTYDGTSALLLPNTSATLTPGLIYTMAVGTFSSASPAKPANYTINVAGPVGGNLYTAAPDPGAGFNYTFVIVNNASGLITAIDPGANMSNATNFPTGMYTVHGLSYSTSITPATLNSYIGVAFTTFLNDIFLNPGTLCSNLSDNSITVNVLAGLPVQFLPLTAFRVNNTVLLKWGTASEQNSSHFEILRSSDGSNFNKVLGTLPAQGNSTSVTNYEFVDRDPGASWNYYRIRQLDLDGRPTLSNIVRINMADKFTAAIVRPNPARSVITVEYFTEKRDLVQVLIVDSKGAVVGRSQFNAQPGRNTHPLNVARFAKGMYAIQLINSDGSITERFIKE